MRIRLVDPNRRGTQAGMMIAAVCLILIAATRVVPFGFTPGCLFYRWTGVPCPTCGATRCLRLIGEFKLGQALAMQPLVFAGVAAVFLWSLISLVVRLSGCRRPRLVVSAKEKSALCWLAGVALLVNWVYLIWASRSWPAESCATTLFDQLVFFWR